MIIKFSDDIILQEWKLIESKHFIRCINSRYIGGKLLIPSIGFYQYADNLYHLYIWNSKSAYKFLYDALDIYQKSDGYKRCLKQNLEEESLKLDNYLIKYSKLLIFT